MYYPHPNNELNRAFSNRPYQGAAPEDAKYLFVSLDANYDKDIEHSKAFPQVIEYLQDGVAFWERYSVHHPFLLPQYSGDGKFFHQSFARIGLTKEHAKDVCFIELLNIPTYGQSQLDLTDLESMTEHLLRLKNVIEGCTARHVFIPTSVGTLMRKTGIFPWMPSRPKVINSPLKQWGTVGSTQMHWHYHFSVYGKFETLKTKQLATIRSLLATDTEVS